MFVQLYFSAAYEVTLGTLTKESWDWIKINFDGFCCNQLLSGLGSVGFFSSRQLLICIMNLKHMSKYSKNSTVFFDVCSSGDCSTQKLRGGLSPKVRVRNTLHLEGKMMD